ncbi:MULTISPECIES: ATP synthase F0 subunit B' [unclassified Brevundimonas]|uniref:F0F1 ATP synthase subunit B family protein n=1 Tax=unclassified Brevundimonas TaxID=2622653 RepID=UPI0006FB6886|nr:MULTISPECIES: ATP synthase F0 subunit B' [unclassified Brevundimonas]KQY79689.1 ATP synthase F0 subunit B' [Brevundimonas sp. Root1423]KRA27815.1 ATP synthase F0 subunit B' [Brevundimonas sp. Root608]
MTVSAQPAVTHDAPPSVDVADTHASTEAAHGEGGGGLPQFEFQHWFGQIVYLIILFALLYWLMAKVFVPRLRGVIDQRAATISDAVSAARQVQAEAAGQAEQAKAEVEAARASSRSMAAAAKARVTEQAAARAAEEEAVVNARIAEAETAIGRTRDAAMTNVSSIASDTAAAIVERLTGKAPTAAEAAAAVKGAA